LDETVLLHLFFEALQLFGFRAFVDKARRPRMVVVDEEGDDRDTELYRFIEFDLCVRAIIVVGLEP